MCRQRIITGIALGLFSYIPLVSWILPIHFIGYVLFVSILSMQVIIFCIFYKSKPSFYLYVPALWVFTEFLRTYLLGGFAWTIGNSQAFNSNVIQIINITGSYGVSFIIVLVNVILFQFLMNSKNRIKNNVISLLVLMGIVGYGFFSLSKIDKDLQNKINVCTIQPNISTQDKNNINLMDEIFDKHIQLSYQCFEGRKPDIIIWPETAVTDDVIRDKIINTKIINFIQEVEVPLLIGSALLVEGNNYNSAVLFDEFGNVNNIYHKKQLVPFMEKVFHFGKQSGVFNFKDKKTLGVAICSEDGYPKNFKKLISRDVDFVVILLNNAWFNQEAGLMMHLQNAIMRAVEFSVPIVRSANTGWSGYINSVGQIQSLDKGLNQERIIQLEVFSSNKKTFYAKFGDIFALLCGFFVILKNIKYKNKSL